MQQDRNYPMDRHTHISFVPKKNLLIPGHDVVVVVAITKNESKKKKKVNANHLPSTVPSRVPRPYQSQQDANM